MKIMRQRSLSEAEPVTGQRSEATQGFGTLTRYPLGLSDGGVAVAMASHIAALTKIETPPLGREEVPVQLSRLLEAHEHILIQARTLARSAAELGDDGTNDLIVSEIVRTNEAQFWFTSEHLVDTPLVRAR